MAKGTYLAELLHEIRKQQGKMTCVRMQAGEDIKILTPWRHLRNGDQLFLEWLPSVDSGDLVSGNYFRDGQHIRTYTRNELRDIFSGSQLENISEYGFFVEIHGKMLVPDGPEASHGIAKRAGAGSLPGMGDSLEGLILAYYLGWADGATFVCRGCKKNSVLDITKVMPADFSSPEMDILLLDILEKIREACPYAHLEQWEVDNGVRAVIGFPNMTVRKIRRNIIPSLIVQLSSTGGTISAGVIAGGYTPKTGMGITCDELNRIPELVAWVEKSTDRLMKLDEEPDKHQLDEIVRICKKIHLPAAAGKSVFESYINKYDNNTLCSTAEAWLEVLKMPAYLPLIRGNVPPYLTDKVEKTMAKLFVTVV